MTKFNKQITTLLTSGAMLLNMAAPALAVTTLEISGNGADSSSQVELNRTTETNVVQSNTAQITNDVSVKADTGDNEANKNTNGDVSVVTGAAEAVVSVENSVNSNMADLNGCADCGGNTDVLISGNGADSDNAVEVSQLNASLVIQNNQADIHNRVDADAKTGDNDAEKNTGGDVSIETGASVVAVGIKTQANANAARIGGNGTGSMLSARILDNGADSENEIELELATLMDVVQSNRANVYNHVDADADTGDNEANKNTGGDVDMETGAATVLVGIDNMTNFNAIDLGCDCFIEDIMARIADNGADSDNYLVADLVDSLGVFQSNCAPLMGSVSLLSNHLDNCDIDNHVDAEAQTGDNDAEKNTGSGSGDDFDVETGPAESTVFLSTEGNVNSVGSSSANSQNGDTSGSSSNSSGIQLSFQLDFSGLLAMLGL